MEGVRGWFGLAGGPREENDERDAEWAAVEDPPWFASLGKTDSLSATRRSRSDAWLPGGTFGWRAGVWAVGLFGAGALVGGLVARYPDLAPVAGAALAAAVTVASVAVCARHQQVP